MPTLETILDTVKDNVSSSMSGLKLGDSDLTFLIGKGWPSKKMFDDASKSRLGVVVAVNPNPMVRNVTRWNPQCVQRTAVATALAASVSASVIEPGESVEVTLSLAPGETAIKENDAVGVPIHLGLFDEGATAKAVVGETLTTLAVKLRDAINARPVLNTWVTATAEGAVVTITNALGAGKGLKVEAHTGNIATDEYEYARRIRYVDICTWHYSPDARVVTGNKLETTIAQWEYEWLTDSNGYSLRVESVGDRVSDKDVLSNLYRRDFCLSIEYGVTVQEQLWAILVASASYNALQNL